jgi:hypothetical protein
MVAVPSLFQSMVTVPTEPASTKHLQSPPISGERVLVAVPEWAHMGAPPEDVDDCVEEDDDEPHATGARSIGTEQASAQAKTGRVLMR